MVTIDTPPRTLPRRYLAWLGGVTVSRLGDAVLAFALGWAAAGLGGTTAALVLTLGGLPRLVLLVVGGAVADRVGARRILIAGEAALLILTAVLALALAWFGTPTWLLLAAALALGTVTAFCLPATGSMPRRSSCRSSAGRPAGDLGRRAPSPRWSASGWSARRFSPCAVGRRPPPPGSP